MRVGIKTNPQDTTWKALVAVWQRADANDAIESAWVFDHFYPIFSDSAGPCLEGWTTLAALAHETDRVLLGTMVNGMPYRHPAITANMAATVDIISNGRLQLGLGAGWNQEEAGAYGISLGATLAERMDMFDEGVEVIVSLLSNDVTNFSGDHYRLTDARNEPKGPQQPHPPIVIGGGGERRTLRTVARWADHWNMTPVTPDVWLHKRDVLRRHCADIGRDPSGITTSMLVRYSHDRSRAIVDDLRALGELGLDKAVVNLPTPHDPDDVDRIAELLAPLP